MKLTFGIFFITLIGGCSTYINPVLLPFKAGGSIQVNSEYDSLVNGSRVYFQNGVRVDTKSLDRWSTYCFLYLYDSARTPDYLVSVPAGEYEISNVAVGYEVVENGEWQTDLAIAALFDWELDEKPSFIRYETHLRLHSDEQPQVQSLTCSYRSVIYGNYYPRLEDMRQALGNLIGIRLNQV